MRHDDDLLDARREFDRMNVRLQFHAYLAIKQAERGPVTAVCEAAELAPLIPGQVLHPRGGTSGLDDLLVAEPSADLAQVKTVRLGQVFDLLLAFFGGARAVERRGTKSPRLAGFDC